ncbi:MAG TPA: M20/M25/M40 family metallo-hydrolase [Gaiellales bacterium]|nr:M20/M25/M40 family metallo-hydrolase [Gaiellales bacterium]
MTAAELVASLVEIESINPSLVPGGSGEAEIAAFVGGWLADAGLEVRADEVAPGRPNVVATARGSGGGRSLLLCAHMDTVGVEGMAAPFTPRESGGRLHGRGAFDMKGGLAAVMLAAAEAARADLGGDVIVAAVCDEEHASIGAEAAVETVWAHAAIVTEPTGLDVCIAHKGFVWLEVEAEGVAAHGSRPDLGVDAIAAMGPVLVGLDGLATELAARPPHPVLGTGSVHASLIEGGQELSSYPERCLLRLERRTVPGETLTAVEAEVRALAGGAEVRSTFERPPFEVEVDAAVVEAVVAHAPAVLGRQPALIGHSAWMDAAILQAAGIPTAVFGPAGEGAHAVEEWVDIASVEACAQVLAAVARDWCAAEA